MNRYFIGLMVPPTISDQLRSFTESIQASVPDAQNSKAVWNAPGDLHCTLLYIGRNDDEQHLVQEMENIAHEIDPVTLTISGDTHWLGRNSLALAVTGAERVGTEFVDKLGHLSSDKWAGRRPFYGHVSLGRVRPVPNVDDDHFAGHTVKRLTWRAGRVQLVTSLNGDSSQRYGVVAEVPFGGVGEGGLTG